MISPLRLLAAAAIFCCATPIPAAGQSSGILLGVRLRGVDEAGGASRYETLWIVRSQDRPLRARLPDLLVPRSSGFWRVGIAGTCSDGPNGEWRIDRLWSVKANVRPVVRDGCPTTSARVLGWRGIVLDSADEAKGDSLKVVCAVEHTEILFLTGEHIGVRRTTSQTEECEPRGGRYDIVPAVTKWGSDSSLALARVAGAGADSAYVRAARAAIASAPVDCEPFVTAERGNDTAEMMDSWYVARDRGRWSAFAYDHIYGSECDLDGGIDLRLPVSFTGHDGLRPSWDVLSRSVPGLIDAFSSPSGDLVVAIVPDSLLAFESDGARLGARLLAIPLPHERIVMAEWAVGAHVTRWDLMIGRLRASLRSARVLSPSR